MAVAFVLNHTHGETTTSGTNNVSATLAGNVAAGNLIVIAMVFDNLSTTTPTITSITVPAGETATWSRIGFCDASSATAAGAVRGECWAIVTTQQWNTGQTITPTLSGAVSAKDIVCSEFSGCTATPRGTQGTTSSASAGTAGALAVTTTGTAPVAGDLCLGGGAVESSTNLTDDTTNTTGGAWSASNKDATAIGGGTSNAGVILQYKIPTVSGHQTYTPGTSAGDAGSYVIALVPSGGTGPETHTGTATLAGAGALAVAGVPAFPSRPVPLATTGALVVAGVPRPAGAPALAATGTLTVAAPAPLVSTLTDDFTTQNTTKWGGWVPGQVDLVSGRVQVTTTSSYYSLNTNSVGAVYALAGSSMMVELVQAPNVGNGTTSASMWFSLDLGTNDVSFQVEGGNLVCRVNLAGVLNNTVPAAYNPTAHRWLRMSESGGTLTWATSPDAVTWTTQRTASTPMSLARGYVMLMSGFYGTETAPGVALFDNFNNVPAPAPVGSSLRLRAGSGARLRGNAPLRAGFVPSLPLIETLVEDFTTQNTAKWTGWNANIVANPRGSLDITLANPYPELVSIGRYRLTGSSMYVKLFSTPPVVSDFSSEMYLKVFSEADNWNSWIGLAWNDSGGVGGEHLYLREVTAGVASDTQIAYVAATMAYVRIREAAGTLYWETSPDAATWTVQRSKVSPTDWTNVATSLNAGYWGTVTGAGVGSWSSVNVAGAAPAFSGTAALSAAGSLAAAGKPTAAGAVPLAGAGSLAVPAVPAAAVPVGLSGGGLLAVSAAPSPKATVTLAGAGVLTRATVAVTAAGAAALAASGAFTAAAIPAFVRPVNLTGSGTFTAGRVVAAPAARGVNESGAEYNVKPDGVWGTFPGTYGSQWFYDAPASIAYLASRGINSTRLPISWERLQPTRGAALDTAESARITSYLDTCQANHIRVIVCPTSFCRYREGAYPTPGITVRLLGVDLTAADFADLWTRMVAAFGAHPAILGWELQGEPFGLPSTNLATTFGATFDTTLSGWTTQNCRIARTTDAPRTGAGALQMTVAQTTSGGTNAQVWFATGGATSLTFSAWVRSPTATSPAQFVIDWYDSSMAYLTSTGYGWINNVSPAWQQTTATVTPPAGAWRGVLSLDAFAATAGDVFIWDDVTSNALAVQTGAQLWEATAQTLVTAIRNTGDTHMIYVPGNEWQSPTNWRTQHPSPFVTDPAGRITYSAHHYYDKDQNATFAYTYAQENADSIAAGYASITDRALSWLALFTDWCAEFGVKGALTETGWPHNADADAWNAVADALYNRLDQLNMDVWVWMVGESYGSANQLAPYDIDGGSTLSRANAQAPVIEAHLAGLPTTRVGLSAVGSLAAPATPAVTAPPALTAVGDLTLAVSTGISYLGAGAVASAAATSITPGLPAGIAANDVLLAVLHSNDNVAVTPPTGWATAGAVNAGTGSRTTVLWKRAAGGDVAQAFTKTGTVAFIGRIIAFRGVALTGNPYAVTPTTTAKTTASTAFSLTGLTPTSINNVIVACVGALVDANSTTVFSGWTSSGTGAMTEAVDNATNTLNGGAVGAAYALRPAAAATGNITGTMTSAVNGGVVVALVPAPPPAAPTTVTATATGTTTVQVVWSGGTTTGVTWTVQYAPAAAGPWSTAAAGLTASPYTHTGLSPGTTYWYRVTAVNPSSGSSASAATSATTVALPKVSTLTDDFATADAAKWTGYGPNVAINAGRLEITTTASYFAVTSVNRYDLRDSIATVEVLQVPNLGNGSTGCNMLLQIDGNNRVEILWEGGQINAKYVVGGVTNNVATTYNAVAHKIWRLRESGGTLYWEASSSGAAWVNLRTPVPMPIDPSSLQVAMTSGFYGTETAPGSALFDNLNATYADPPAAPRTIYVDPAGSDANDGLSTSTPWATVAKVTNTLLYPGDQVLFLRGQQWTGNLVITGSGTAAAPIFIGAYGTPAADIPTITGGGSSSVQGTLKPLEIYGSYVTVDSVELNGSIDRDIYINGSDCLIQGCAIRWGAVGIEQTTQAARLKIQYNSFIDVNVGIIQPGTNDDYGANCIILDGDAAEVAHNTASGAWYASPDYGMDGSFCDIYGATNAVIHHNYASETVAFGEIGNPSSDNNTFHNNVFVSTLSLATGFVVHGALYQDASVDPFGPVLNTKIHHNTVVLPGGGSGAAGVWLSPNGEIDLQNNIFVVTAAATMAAIYDSNRIITEAGNVFYANGGVNITLPAGGLDPSSIIADPLFVSPTDLRLQPGSPALDRGIDLGYATDYAGNPRIVGSAPDSGAYEGAAVTAFAGAVALSGAGSLAAAAAPALPGAPALAATGSLAVAGAPAFPSAAAAYTATGALTVSAAPRVVGVAALAGSGVLALTAVPALVAPAALTGSGTLTVTAAGAGAGQVVLTAAAALTLSALPAAQGLSGLTTQGALTISPAGLTAAGAVALTGAGVLTVPARVPALAAPAVFTAAGALTFAAVTAAGGVATFTGAGSLGVLGAGGAGLVPLTATGTLSAGVTAFTVSAVVALTGAGALGVGVSVVAVSGSAVLAASGALAVAAAPAPVAPVALTASGALTVAAAPAAVTAVALTASGALLTITASIAATGVAALSSSGVLAVATGAGGGGAVSLSAAATLLTAAVPALAAAPALSASGVLALAAIPAAKGAPALTMVGVLTSAGAVGAGVFLASAGALAVVVVPRPTGTAALAGTGALLAAAAVVTARGAVTLTAAGVLGMAVAAVTVTVAAALSGGGQLTIAGVGLGAIVHRSDLGRTARGAAGVTRRSDLGRTNHS